MEPAKTNSLAEAGAVPSWLSNGRIHLAPEQRAFRLSAAWRDKVTIACRPERVWRLGRRVAPAGDAAPYRSDPDKLRRGRWLQMPACARLPTIPDVAPPATTGAFCAADPANRCCGRDTD